MSTNEIFAWKCVLLAIAATLFALILVLATVIGMMVQEASPHDSKCSASDLNRQIGLLGIFGGAIIAVMVLLVIFAVRL